MTLDEALRPQACGSFVVLRHLNNFRKYLSMEERERLLGPLVPAIVALADQHKAMELVREQCIKHWFNAAYGICNKFVGRRAVKGLTTPSAELHERAGKLRLEYNKTLRKMTEKELDAHSRLSYPIIKLILTQSGIRTVCDNADKFHFYVIEELCASAIRHMILKTMMAGRTEDFDVWGKIETDAQILRTEIQKSFLSTIGAML